MKGLAVAFRERGCDARPVTPAEVVLDSEGAIYRHIFARYVEPKSVLAQAFLGASRWTKESRVEEFLESWGYLGIFLGLVATGNGRSRLRLLTGRGPAPEPVPTHIELPEFLPTELNGAVDEGIVATRQRIAVSA